VRRVLAPLVLGTASVVVALVCTEIALRVIGFSFRLYPEKIEFGWPDPEILSTEFRADPELIWVPPDYRERLDVPADDPVIVLLGDSCTERSAWPDSLERFVDVATGGEWPGHVVNAAVAGWSSYQGRHQLARDVLPLDPEIVVVYFGWNDHWLGYGVEDEEIARVGRLRDAWVTSLRVVQLVQKARIGRMRRRTGPLLRVSPESYRENLATMVREAHSAGAAIVLVTAPTSMRPDSVPEYLAERHIDDLSRVIPLHERYNDIVREVARAEGAVLCDVDADVKALPPDVVERTVFLDDRIHLTDPGSGFVARRVYRCLVESGVIANVLRGDSEARGSSGSDPAG
jgi:lysophospholipase L1-like esterase